MIVGILTGLGRWNPSRLNLRSTRSEFGAASSLLSLIRLGWVMWAQGGKFPLGAEALK